MSPQSSHHTVDIPSWITLRWTRGTRYYRAHLEQDLWHGWLLTLVHGRIGTRLGRARASSSLSLETALTELAAITKRRRQRGYQLTN
jgi:predicted DNA-binding WGR domain protein